MIKKMKSGTVVVVVPAIYTTPQLGYGRFPFQWSVLIKAYQLTEEKTVLLGPALRKHSENSFLELKPKKKRAQQAALQRVAK